MHPSFPALVAISLLAADCASGEHYNPEVEHTRVRVVEDSVPMQQIPPVVSFHVTVVIRNEGLQPVVFGGCGPEAQRYIGGRWETVWSPMCLMPAQTPLSPGDSLTLPITVAASSGINIQPFLDPRMIAGTYRLRFGVWYQGSPLTTAPAQLDPLDSPPFKVY